MIVVLLPDHEEVLCEWPQADRVKGAHHGDYIGAPKTTHHEYRYSYLSGESEPGEVVGSSCWRAHQGNVLWNGAEWFCTKCNRVIKAEEAPAIYRESAVRVPRKIDTWYAEETALYRRGAVTNSGFGVIRMVVDRWRQPGLRDDYMHRLRRHRGGR